MKSGFAADDSATDGRGWSINLDLFRVSYLALAVFPWAFSNLYWVTGVMPHLARSLWVPISFYRWIPIEIVSDAKLAYILAIANLAFLFLGLIGSFTRLALGCASLLSLYLFGLTENQGKIDHMHHLVWFLILLAAGPTGRFLSIDSLWRAAKNTDPAHLEQPLPRFDALWTLRFVWILLGLLYLIPGLAKLNKAIAAGWATSDNLLNVFWRKWLEISLFTGAGAKPLVRLDFFPPWMVVFGGLSAIVFEIGFLFIVLFRRCRVPAGLAGIGFHVLNGLTLQIWFTSLLPAYLALVDWYQLGRRLIRADKRQIFVLFDSKCSFCTRTLTTLRSLDLFDAMRPVPLDSVGAQRFSSISQEAGERDLHVIDGSAAYAGFQAYRVIARRIPLLWPLFIVMELPGISRAGERIYRRIADSRHCSIMPPRNNKSRPHPSKRAVLTVGTILFACQFIIGFVMWADIEWRDNVEKLPRQVRRIFLGVGKRMPAWPFMYYPTFAFPTPSQQCIWQGRWTIDDRNVVISPLTYDQAFHNSGAVWAIVNDPARESRLQSLDLLRTLWKAESSEVQQATTGALVSHVCYLLGPASQAPGRIESAQLLFTFRRDEIAQ